MESLYESWAKRNPSWERRYQSTVVDVFCDYGKGVSSFLEARGKIFGAGYEIFIIAFFIGLYQLNSSYKCNGIHINNLFKFFVWCEVSKSFTRSII